MSTLTSRQAASRSRHVSANALGRLPDQQHPWGRFAARTLEAISRWIARARDARQRRLAYRRSLAELQVLSDRTLGDIGLRRSTLMSAAIHGTRRPR